MSAPKIRNGVDRSAMTEADYLAATRSESTRAEYAKDVQHFVNAGGSVPATVDQVAEYVRHMATWLAVATIEKRLVTRVRQKYG